MPPVMRAKMKVTSVEELDQGENLHLAAVSKPEGYDSEGNDENNTFAKFTPSASAEMYINNPELKGKFKPDQEFYVDFTEVIN